jgi:hypothetical protein
MISQQFVLVDPTTGRIMGYIAGNGAVDMSPHHEGLELYEHDPVDAAFFYFKDGEFRVRPDCPVQLAYTPARNVVVLSGVPVGTKLKLISISGEHEIVMQDSDGKLKLEFPTTGRYQILWDDFPYKSFRASIEV